jgi:hypothetical protein
MSSVYPGVPFGAPSLFRVYPCERRNPNESQIHNRVRRRSRSPLHTNGAQTQEGGIKVLSDLGKKLLNLASDLSEAVKEQNWFKVRGVQNDLIKMSIDEGAEEVVPNDQ